MNLDYYSHTLTFSIFIYVCVFCFYRPYPNISMAERFNFTSENCITQVSEHELLSQYPLMQETLPSEGESSCCSLSQHSFSPLNDSRPKTTTSHSSLFVKTVGKESAPRDKTEPVTDPQPNPKGEAAEDEAFFLNQKIPAQHLLELLRKDIGLLTDSSTTVSSASVVSGNINPSVSEEPTKSHTSRQAVAQPEAPQEVSLSQQHRDRENSWAQPSEDSHITAGCRSTKPDHSSEVLHRQLLKETEQPNTYLGGSDKQCGQTHPTQMSDGKSSDAEKVPHKGSWTGPFSVGVERGHREQLLWSLGNQTDDGSYLGFLPQSQSTPGIFLAPSKASTKTKAQQLSESRKENSSQSDVGVSAHSHDHKSRESNPDREKAASAEVPSLPSVSYMQKVDAWRANQTSGKTSLLDSLALQGFPGTPPKKRVHEAISDTLAHLLSQKQPLVSVPANQGGTESSSLVLSGSSLKRGREEAMSSIPSEKDNTGASKGPSGFPSTASQSHSSLSTVVSDRKDQGSQSTGNYKTLTTGDVPPVPGTTAQLSALLGLGHFTDVSADHDVTLSNSQGSNGSGIKLGASIGASSVVSLEVDNYAPYWTSKPSTPLPHPRSRELNIEERIPVFVYYLYFYLNLFRYA